MKQRIAEITRKTKETDITVKLTLEGSGNFKIDSGIGFFDHMLHSFAGHGFFDLELTVKGDIYVDTHHTIEDTGIVLGQAFDQAWGNKEGIKRYGSCTLPMDDALVLCSLDLCGRNYLAFDVPFTVEKVGCMDTEMVREFFYAFVSGSKINLHLKKLDGQNNHHIMEAAFKAFSKALDQAVTYDERIKGVLSTKGKL